jgi:hypothetical protein
MTLGCFANFLFGFLTNAIDPEACGNSGCGCRRIPRGSCTVLGAPRGEIPPGDSTSTSFQAQVAHFRFSNRPFEVKRFRDDPPPQFRCRSRAHASLRNRRQRPSIMGFEDEVEQSMPRPLPLRNGRSKRTCELTSSIVPRGTSFHRLVETRVSFYWI